MILGAILATISLFLLAIISILPTATGTVLPEAVQQGWSLVTGYALQWDSIVPVLDMFIALSIYVTAWVFVLTWKMVKWIISVVRT